MTYLAALTLTLYGFLAIQMARMHGHLIEHLDRKILSTKGFIRMSAQDTINTVVAQLRKARAEVLEARDSLNAKIVDLQSQLDTAGVADQVDLSELQSVAQDLDDIVPDPAEVPDQVPAEVPADTPAEVPAAPVE